MTPTVATSKAELRRAVLDRRARLTPEQLADAGEAFTARVLELTADAQSVAVYLSSGYEPATWAIADALLGRGVDVISPVVVRAGELDWVRYAGPGTVTPNRFGIDEPTGERLGATAHVVMDVIVLPGLAVDREGNRLGRGGGYYDRALTVEGVGADTVLLVYDDEVVDSVPHELHDQRIAQAVTPTRTLRFSP